MAKIFFDRSDQTEVLSDCPFADLAELSSPEETTEGFLIVEGRITRTGVFRYVLDGRSLNVLRPPEEVFDSATLQSFELSPITLGHPEKNGRRFLLSPENAKEHAVGSVGMPRRVGDHAIAKMKITDAKAIALARKGGKLSAGYGADVWFQSGTFVDDAGERTKFDAVQRRINGNHIAIVDSPRVGPSAEFRGFDGGIYDGETEPMKTKKIKIHGIDVEVDEAVADQLERAETERTKKVETKVADSNDGELSRLKGENAALKEQLTNKSTEESKSAEKEANKARIKERVSLLAKASALLDCDADELADLEPIEVMKKVIGSRSKIDVADSTDEAFVRGVFAAISTDSKPKKKAKDEDEDNGLIDALRSKAGKKIETSDENEDENPIHTAFTKSIKESQEAWKTGLSKRAAE